MSIRLGSLRRSRKTRLVRAIMSNQNQPRLGRTYLGSLLGPGSKRLGPTKFQNRCMLTGRIKGYQRLASVSRQGLKRLAVLGRLQNVTTRSW
jgi:ribosomal protein S14